MRQFFTILPILIFSFLLDCSSTQQATQFGGLTTPDGRLESYQVTTNVGLNVFIAIPMFGEATVEKTVHTFVTEAKKRRATKFRISAANRVYLWYVLPPISLIVTPVYTEVMGDVYD